ncbi:MAG: TetR/AcrR family transcriptional regulator [Phycisphaeraceae bacterium]|nr:TetR/AcrR family transcriptional regulator [Phycisphaeraceae bacterium]
MTRLPAAKRKAQLLDAAAKVFATHGYSGTTTSELAKAAGVSEPIIYRHFQSKRELFIELVERTGEDTIRFWEEALQGVTDPGERLMRLIGGNPMVTPKGFIRYRVIVQAMTEVEEKDIQQALQQHLSKLHDFLAKEVQLAQDSGQVSRRFSPDLTAWTLIYLALGYGVLTALKVPGHGIDKQGNHVDDIIGLVMLGDRYKRPQA